MAEKETDLVNEIEKAVEKGDQATIERLVNRSRWDQDMEEDVSEKPLIYPKVPY